MATFELIRWSKIDQVSLRVPSGWLFAGLGLWVDLNERSKGGGCLLASQRPPLLKRSRISWAGTFAMGHSAGLPP